MAGDTLGPWTDATHHQAGASDRWRVEDSGGPPTALAAPIGGCWKVWMRPGVSEAIQGRFAAPTLGIAKLYADDLLFQLGFAGEGIGPLPAGYPPLRERRNVQVSSAVHPDILAEVAECACGYVGADAMDRYAPCTGCGGYEILTADALARIVGLIR